MLHAAGHPPRRRPGLAERDQLVLLTLAMTGLRRSELIALDWGDVTLNATARGRRCSCAAERVASRAGSRSRSTYRKAPHLRGLPLAGL